MPFESPSRLRPLLWPVAWDTELIPLVAGSGVDCIVVAPTAASIAAAAERAGLRVIQHGGAELPPPDGVTVVNDGVWAKVVRSREDPTSTEAGPTGLPWIDSNGWRIQLARALSPGKTPWVRFSPPAKEVLRAGAYQIASADCEANGGRWVVELDTDLSSGIAAGNSAARDTWKAILQVVAFYRSQPRISEAQGSGALLGVLSSFVGEDELISHEFLNLIAREYVPAQILIKSDPPANLDGLLAVIYLDEKPLPQSWLWAITLFVSAGGTLITSRTADPKLGSPAPDVPGLDYQIRRAGKGRVAVALEDFQDPWRVAADAHVLLGRSHDLLRHANAGSMNMVYAAAAGGGRAQVELVSYSLQRALNPVTVTLRHRFTSARFRSCGNPTAIDVPLAVEYGRTAVYLPHFAICGSLDLRA